MTESEQLQQQVADLTRQLADMRATGEATARERDRWHTAWANQEHTITGLRQVISGAESALAPVAAARDRLAADVLRLELELDAAEKQPPVQT